MSLRQQGIGPVPEETERVARAAFPKGSVYMRLRDELGTIYEDRDFADLFAVRGQPGERPWRLALVTVMQYAEGLTDRQAAEAVRGRIDWKYALGLELEDAGFDYSVLSEFRARLVHGGAEQRLLDRLLGQLAERGLLKGKSQQRTDSTHVLAAIGVLNRLELVGEALHHSLEVLALVVPEWLKSWVSGEWYERYEGRLREYRLPKAEQERQALAEQIGRDGVLLLSQVYEAEHLPWLRALPAVEILRRVWVQQYYPQEGEVHWRVSGNLPPAERMLSSPYDTEARYGTKRTYSWVGYKVHLTETCSTGSPHLITHVETTLATQQDVEVVEAIHQALAEHDLLPAVHLVDMGYPAGDVLVSSQQQYGLDLFGPVRPDTSWQAHAAQGFDLTHFDIDWDAHTAHCPQGNTSQTWTPHQGRDRHLYIKINFSPSDCVPCPVRALCTRSQTGARHLSVLPKDLHLALQAARQRQTTNDFKTRYRLRAGVEGTISQAAHALELRRARYRGLAKTHLQGVITAVAINLTRTLAWLSGIPLAVTRPSHFAPLAT